MGRLGYPIFVSAYINPLPGLSKLIPFYREARRSAGHPDRGGEDITMLLPLHVGEDRAQIRQEVEPGVTSFLRVIERERLAVLNGQRGHTYSEAERKRCQDIVEVIRSCTYERVCEAMAVFDTPDACVRRLRWIQQELNVGRVICFFNMGGMIPHDRVLRSMELFAAKVMPHFSSGAP
jgi:hypothetical protein